MTAVLPGTDLDVAGEVTDTLLTRVVEGLASSARDDPLRIAADLGSPLGGELGGPDEVLALREAMRLRLDPSGPLRRLAAAAQLDDVATEVLGVLAALAADPRRGRLLAWLHGRQDLRCATVGSLTALFDGDPAAALAAGPDGPLQRARLLRDEEPASCWADTPLALHPDVLWWLWSCGETAVADLRLLSGEGRHRRLVVAGPDRVRRLGAVEAALSAQTALVVLVPDTAAEWDALVRTATLAGAALVLEVGDELPPPVARQLERASHLPWALCSQEHLPVEQLPRTDWHALEPAPPRAAPDELAAALPDPAQVGDQLRADQLAALEVLLPSAHGDVRAAVRLLAARGGLARIAERTVPTRAWDDLVLPDRQAEQVRHVVDRARHRDLVYDGWGFPARPSRGVVAMFAGPSGTGKTLAAEVVAGALGLDVYRLDLSQLVDKYVGETEKNLAAAFDAAAASPVVLFFDEADALLGKRSAVQDAQDRFANLQVAYLLQRLERHDGVVLLATNLPGNLDEAFTRRLHVTVDFPMPGPEERRRIWARAVPAAAPCTDVDLDDLAERYELSGGAIRNAAQTTAFLAAAAGSGLTTALLEVAVRQELEKAGHLVLGQTLHR